MAEAELTDGTPQWTQQSMAQGLDPLGMQNTSITLYQSLVPGISNVTLRMRYYGLHSWLTHEYAKRQASTDEMQWRRFVRRGEALYALICQHQTQEPGVAGNRWAGNRLKQHDDKKPLEFSVFTDQEPGQKQYLKQKVGAFGAAYQSQLKEVGLIRDADKHKLPIVVDAKPTGLAQTFSAEVGAAGKQFLRAIDKGSVTVAELKRMGSMVPSLIDGESDERQLYQDLLFAPGLKGDAPALRRRDTLRLILHTARQLKHLPDSDDVRWTAYSGFDHLGKPLPALPDADAEQRYRWRVYHANDLMHVCHESLLRYLLEVLTEHPGGVPMAPLLTTVVTRLLAVPKHCPATWADLEKSVPVPQNAWSNDEDAEYSLCTELLAPKAAQALTAPRAYLALRLLALLGKRLRPERERIASVLAPFARERSQTVLSELAFMDDRHDLPVEQALAQFIRQRVVDRHLAVALQKMRGGDYTFVFEIDEGRVRWRAPAAAVLTNPRLRSAIAFLRDIHLLDDGGITDLGRKVLAKP
jgi:hypothetical protein